MGFTKLDLANALQEVLKPEIEKVFKSMPVMNEKYIPVMDADTIEGIEWRVKVKRPTTMEYIGNPATASVPIVFPEGGSPAYIRKTIDLTMVIAPFTLDHILATAVERGDKAIPDNVIADNVQDFTDYVKAQLQRAYYQDGTGFLTTIADEVEGEGSEVDISVVDSTYLEPGQVVDVIHSGSVLVTLTIVKVKSETIVTAVVPEGVTLSAGDVVVLNGAYNKDMAGLDLLIGTGDLYGITASNYYWWQSAIEDNGGSMANFNLSKFRTLLQRLARRNDNKVPDYCLCNPDVYKAVEAVVTRGNQQTSIFFEGNARSINFGVSNIVIDGCTIISDSACPNNKMFLFNYGDIKRLRYLDFSLVDFDGLKWRMHVNSSGQFIGKYSMFYQHIGNLAIQRRWTTGKYININGYSAGTY